MNKMFDKMNKKFDIMNTMFDFTNKMFLFLKFTCFGNMIRISRPDTNSSNIPKRKKEIKIFGQIYIWDTPISRNKETVKYLQNYWYNFVIF